MATTFLAPRAPIGEEFVKPIRKVGGISIFKSVSVCKDVVFVNCRNFFNPTNEFVKQVRIFFLLCVKVSL